MSFKSLQELLNNRWPRVKAKEGKPLGLSPTQRKGYKLFKAGKIMDLVCQGVYTSDGIKEGWYFYDNPAPVSIDDVEDNLAQLFHFLLLELDDFLDQRGLTDTKARALTHNINLGYEDAWNIKVSYSLDDVMEDLALLAVEKSSIYASINDLVSVMRFFDITRERFDSIMDRKWVAPF